MKTQQELEERLAEIEADDRLEYPLANVQVNAPLALVQLGLKSRAEELRWALGLPHKLYHGRGNDGTE